MFAFARFVVRNKVIVAVGGIAVFAFVSGFGQNDPNKASSPWNSQPPSASADTASAKPGAVMSFVKDAASKAGIGNADTKSVTETWDNNADKYKQATGDN